MRYGVIDPASRFERRTFAGLTALGALVIGVLPVIPGHDMPQHVAYLGLLAAWRLDPSTYPPAYTAPDLSSGYATTYKWMTPLAAWTSAEVAMRLVLAAYVVLLALAVRALVRATWSERTGGTPATALLGPLAPFNPVLCMGFLPYLLALPPLVGSLAAGVGYLRGGRRWLLALAVLLAAVTAAFHLVAAAALLFLAGALAVARRDRRSLALLAGALVGVVITTRLVGGTPPLPADLGATLARNVHARGVIAGVVATFRISSTHWLDKLDQVIASVVGPFPLVGKVLASAVIGAMIALDLRARRRTGEAPRRGVLGVGVACLALALAAILAPAAIQVPDDISLLDFRLITTATLVGIAAIPPGAVTRERVLVLASGVALLLGLWMRQLGGAAGELAQTTRLIERLAPSDRLLSLSMHDASSYLDERNAILHYAAVYHTARSGGVTSLFWGKFTPRLPVGYLPGKQPDGPPDWSPWMVTENQLAGFTHVVVRWPTDRDDVELRELAPRIVALRDHGDLEPVASDGDCTLFKVTGNQAVRLSSSR
jgi:hypothetical protein